MMRVSKALGSWFGRGVAMAAALVALSTATDARADEEFTAKGVNWVRDRITEKNMGALLGKYVDAGDIIIDLA